MRAGYTALYCSRRGHCIALFRCEELLFCLVCTALESCCRLDRELTARERVLMFYVLRSEARDALVREVLRLAIKTVFALTAVVSLSHII